MRSTRAALLLVLMAFVPSAGCFAPSAGLYQPASEREFDLFARARRDVTPDTIRAADASAEPGLLAWAGVLHSVEPGPDPSSTITFKVEHHYWDWVVDYGTQTTRILLSPRGEGTFQFSLTGKEAAWLADNAQIGDFTIVYGVPKDVLPDGTIELLYVHARGIPESRYALDVWDYDADFAVRGQGSPRQIRLRPF